MNVDIVFKFLENYKGITLKKADKDQRILLVEIILRKNFKKKTKPQNPEKKQETLKIFLKTYIFLLRIEKEFLMLLKAKYFQ